MQKSMSRAALVSGSFLGAVWMVYFFGLLFSLDLAMFGIQPRSFGGLIGIPFAPFLHANFAHLMANSPALFILLFMAFAVDFLAAIVAVLLITVLGGLGTWLFGSPYSVHVGASGLIFGLVGYLIFRGWYRKDMKSIIVSFLVFFFYGGLFFSLLTVNS